MAAATDRYSEYLITLAFALQQCASVLRLYLQCLSSLIKIPASSILRLHDTWFYLQVSCSLVAAALHYLFLAAFCWMTVEGHHLYRMVVTVFDSGRDFRCWYLLMGYGVPAIVVVVTKIVAICRDEKAYGRDELYVRCSLLQDRKFMCGINNNALLTLCRLTTYIQYMSYCTANLQKLQF
jgi:hypothetical protein